MNTLDENISFLKEFVEKRETYIRFSPLGTAIMGILYIVYYFFWWNLWDKTVVFLCFAWIWVLEMTILSIFESKMRHENVFPKSIQHIIVNLIFSWIAYTAIVGLLINTSLKIYIIPLSCLLYGLLIIVSRLSLPRCIMYFWYICFFVWCVSMFYLNDIDMMVLGVFGIGHIVVAGILKYNYNAYGRIQ